MPTPDDSPTDDTTDQNKRTLLKLLGSGSVLASTAGCTDRIPGAGWFSDGPDEGTESEAESEPAQPTNDTDNSTDGSTNESVEPTTEPGPDPHQNETTNDTQPDPADRQVEPDPEQTQINRSKYNETEVKETEQLPESAVTVTGDVTFEDDWTVKIRNSTVTNETDEHIDLVDVVARYLNVFGDEVGDGICSVYDLDPGQTKDAPDITAQPHELRGEPHTVDVTPVPQNYVNGD